MLSALKGMHGLLTRTNARRVAATQRSESLLTLGCRRWRIDLARHGIHLVVYSVAQDFVDDDGDCNQDGRADRIFCEFGAVLISKQLQKSFHLSSLPLKNSPPGSYRILVGRTYGVVHVAPVTLAATPLFESLIASPSSV